MLYSHIIWINIYYMPYFTPISDHVSYGLNTILSHAQGKGYVINQTS